ncbi:DUF817 domain-containing protein [Agrococcus baldri]|uniref:DUF817 domain-containing protein n=1 Tax=Agrococcus baldri TaxID=153730 RepID=A0AA87UVR4_9MICO|nr:DUF817 domain-containing protein [Agrococcus baldri]GEK78782.1 hypothetical protein ABA31_01330 [Agrococcus baldri]
MTGGARGRREFTAVEEAIDRAAHRLLDGRGRSRWRRAVIELGVFGLKQGWAAIFGGLLLACILAARLWWPDDAPIARNDALTIAAVVIQVAMLALRLETLRELWVVLLFHVAGTVMELFKTDVGSWAYEAEGMLRIGGVPLFSGFMYAAVGSYMVRTMRMFDLRFTRYPPMWATILVAACIYANFFTHHFIWDLRWVLVAAVLVLWGGCVMRFRVLRSHLRMPVVVAFGLVAVVIWGAENLATLGGAWLYPNQMDGWEPVSGSKVVSWFLLMILSVVLVTLVHRPRGPEPAPEVHLQDADTPPAVHRGASDD